MRKLLAAPDPSQALAFMAEAGVLPAFGAFTGMHVMPRAPGDRVFVVAGDAVRPLPGLHTLAA